MDLRRYLSKFSSKLLIGLFVIAVAGFSLASVGKFRNSGQSQGKVLGASTTVGQEQSSDSTNAFVKTAQAANLADGDKADNKPFVYEVEGGDTLSGIAKKYDLNLNTIIWANGMNAKSVIKPGQQITLLPVDGVLHTVVKGDTISEIAKMHKADSDKTIAYNAVDDVSKIHVGDMIIVPDGQPLPPPPAPKVAKGNGNSVGKQQDIQVPSGLAGTLVWPTTTRNLSQGYSASHRGLDIANGGKPPILAANSGTVESASYQGDWGNSIVIRGDDGLVTRYSHASALNVSQGDKVSAGDTIGTVGNTGHVIGVTGLHLDFRVYKNGVAINPKTVLR